MRIKSKLIVTFSVILAMFLSLGMIYSFFEIEISNVAEYHDKMRVPATNLLQEIKTCYFVMEANGFEFTHNFEDGKEVYYEKRSQLLSTINEYDKLVFAKGNKDKFLADAMMRENIQGYVTEMKESLQKSNQYFDEMFIVYENGGSDAEINFFVEQIETEEDIFIGIVDLALNMEMVGQEQKDFLREKYEYSSFVITTGLGTGFILFILASGLYLFYSITLPLVKLQKGIKVVTEGDYNQKIELQNKDELGELAEKFDFMRQKIKNKRETLQSEIKHRTIELEKANERLKKLDTAKAEFVAMISHEMKTPLVPIRGWCDALRDQKLMGPLNKGQIDAIDSIHSSSEKLKSLIENMLEVHKLELGKLRINEEVFDVNEFSEKIIKDLMFLAKSKRVNIINKIDKRFFLKSDCYRLNLVVSNLIKNAIDFVPEKSGKIELDIQDYGDEVIFSVKDNGIGISEEQQKNIFKKFYQVENKSKRISLGTGLGLSVCKGIVEALGGTIWVESKPGKGSTFTFTIPKDSTKAVVPSS